MSQTDQTDQTGETGDQTTQVTGEMSGEMTGDMSGDFVRHLGLEFGELSGDLVTATWSIRPALHQPFGLLHGGVHCSVVETLASVGGALWLGDKGHVVGVNNNTDFLRGLSEGDLTSTSTPIHRGRSQQLWLVETIDTEGRMIARGQVRLHNLYAQA